MAIDKEHINQIVPKEINIKNENYALDYKRPVSTTVLETPAAIISKF